MSGLKAFGAVLLTIIAVFALAIGISFAAGATDWITAPFRGKVDQRNKTVGNGDYRIASYDHFYDLCAAIQGKEASITNLAAEASSGTDDADRLAQVTSAITAQRNTRAELVTQYNADARKAGTSGQFRASDLPYSIDITGEHTSCTS